MTQQDTISRCIGYILLFVLLSIIICQLWNKLNYTTEGFQNNMAMEMYKNDVRNVVEKSDFKNIILNQIDEAMKEEKKQNELPKVKFIYAGYNQIYDYVISKSIYNTLHHQENLGKKKKINHFSFEDIPRLYVYILENQPTRINIIFTKLKKSSNLINLFNNQLQQTNIEIENNKIFPKKDKLVNNSNTESRDINNQKLDVIKNLLIKHNLTNVEYDIKENRDEILTLLRLSSNLNYNILNQFIFHSTDNQILKSRHNIVSNSQIAKTLFLDTNYQNIYNTYNNIGEKDVKHKFTNVLLGTSNFIFDDKIADFVFHQEDLVYMNEIKHYLFKNNNLGINISLDRLDKFIMNEINSNLIEVYFKLSNRKGELSNKEIYAKFATAFNIELSKEFIETHKKLLDQENNNQNTEVVDEESDNKEFYTDKLTNLNNIKASLSFYYLHNKFQVVKVIIRPYEGYLIM